MYRLNPRTLPSYRRRIPPTSLVRAASNSAASMLPESTSLHLRQILVAALLFAAVSLFCLFLIGDADYSRFASTTIFSRFPTVFHSASNDAATDADIMWFRDPFPRFHLDADFQIACDHFTGSFDDVENRPNGGFNYVKSNNRSIEFYKFWYSSQESYPGYHDQDVLNFIKFDPFLTD